MYFNLVLIDFVIGSTSAIICEHAGIDNKIGLGHYRIQLKNGLQVMQAIFSADHPLM